MMKSRFISAVLLCGMLVCGCVDFSYTGSVYGEQSLIPDSPKEVELYIGEAADIVGSEFAKGSGSIESTDEFADGRHFYVYGFNQDALTSFSIKSIDNSVRCLVDGSIDDPDTKAGREAKWDSKFMRAKWVNGGDVFWPIKEDRGNRYDFFAYYVDDMKLDEEDYHRNEDNVIIDVEIDGSQDIMSSKAAPSDKKLEGQFPNDEIERINYKYYYCYSYDSAMKDLQPEFVFTHHLVKLRFKIVSGETKGYKSAINLKGIGVESKYKAYFKVADKVDPSGIGLTFKPEYKELHLTGTKGAPFKGVKINTYEAGEQQPDDVILEGSLLVAPDSRYKLHMLMDEKRTDGVNWGEYDNVVEIYRGSAKENPMSFLAGNEYLVTLTVYGRMVVDFSIEVKKWESGGDYIYDSDEDGWTN